MFHEAGAKVQSEVFGFRVHVSPLKTSPECCRASTAERYLHGEHNWLPTTVHLCFLADLRPCVSTADVIKNIIRDQEADVTCDTAAELLGFVVMASSQQSFSRSLHLSDWLLCSCVESQQAFFFFFFYFISY